MHHQSNRIVVEQSSWLDCIGELSIKHSIASMDQVLFKEDPILMEIPAQSCKLANNKEKIPTQPRSHQKKQKQTQFGTRMSKSKEALFQIQCLLNAHNEQEEVKEDESSSKDQSKQSNKLSKWGKQSQYSKNYRQKKKEQMKILEEQNNYLKNKINELQIRLREKELEINRLKHPPVEKQLSVQQLNEQFLNKISLLISKKQIDPANYGKPVITRFDKQYDEFTRLYDEQGFGGSRKKNILTYYFNEMLEATLRDSEKYLFLICNQAQDYQKIKGLESYEQIDFMFREVMQFDEDNSHRLKHFTLNLHCFMVQLKDICCNICNDFDRIINFLDRVHSFMKCSYPNNMDLARKRFEFENWFENNKHSKLMRRLRSEWVDFIKQVAGSDSELKGPSKSRRKNNLQHKDNP